MHLATTGIVATVQHGTPAYSPGCAHCPTASRASSSSTAGGSQPSPRPCSRRPRPAPSRPWASCSTRRTSPPSAHQTMSTAPMRTAPATTWRVTPSRGLYCTVTDTELHIAAHEGDFTVPSGWTAQTETFAGIRDAKRRDRRDMIMFSPACVPIRRRVGCGVPSEDQDQADPARLQAVGLRVSRVG